MRGEPLLAALNVALAKARAVSAGGSVVIGADTVVALDGAALGKPVDGAAATEMLLALRGRAHEVLTGVALREPNGQEWAGVVSTRVVMRTYSDGEIAGYVARWRRARCAARARRWWRSADADRGPPCSMVLRILSSH